MRHRTDRYQIQLAPGTAESNVISDVRAFHAPTFVAAKRSISLTPRCRDSGIWGHTTAEERM